MQRIFALILFLVVAFPPYPALAQVLTPPDLPTTPLSQWEFIVGFFAPLFIAFLVNRRWPSWLKSLTAFAICVIVGIGTAFFRGLLSPGDMVASALAVFVIATAAYRGLWYPTKAAPAIEKATSG